MAHVETSADNLHPARPDGYLSLAELAVLWGVSLKTLRKIAKQPDGLRTQLFAGKRIVRVETAKHWLADRETAPAPARRGRRAAA